MHFTGYGENFVRSDRSSQFYRGHQLAAAQDISDHVTIDVKDGICYDITAYMRFLLGQVFPSTRYAAHRAKTGFRY